MNKYIRFDWAMKRLLRNKANFVVLEGFLSVLLEQDIRIQRFLESEGNQEDAHDKYNRVDILCEDTDGRKIIIEVQNERAYDYFHRMAYGTSKVITDYMELGDGYEKVQKVYAVNIVYFDLGQGTDYVYRGRTDFHGLHNGDLLRLSAKQRELFGGEEPADILPEYFVLKVNNFNQVAKESLDQWMSFLKTGDIPDSFTAPGLPEARERLRIANLTDNERQQYERDMRNQMIENSEIKSLLIDERDELRKTIANRMRAKGYSEEQIADILGETNNEI